MKTFWLFLSLLLLIAGVPAGAAEGDRADAGEMPEVESGEVIEPDITIIEQEDKTIRQFSVNGQVYMVQIIPAGGAPPYYLLDLDGDGMMDVRRDGPDDIAVPQWVILRW
jgi:hypothetical protein